MLQPFLNGFNMTIHHGAIGADTQPVSGLYRFNPLGSGSLFRTDNFPYSIAKNLCATPW